LEKDSRYRSVRAEQPIGDSGSTADVAAITHSGRMEAWEVCLGPGYVLQNTVKYRNTAFARITLLAPSYELSMTIKNFIKASSLEPGILARLDFMHFSQLLQQQRRLSLASERR